MTGLRPSFISSNAATMPAAPAPTTGNFGAELVRGQLAEARRMLDPVVEREREVRPEIGDRPLVGRVR
jgi:hypothetical protein